MSHARTCCISVLINCDISLSVSVSQTESKNPEKRFISRLTFACPDVCGDDT